MFAKALDAVSQGVLIAGPDRRILYVNAGFSEITGYAPEDLIGDTCRRLHGPETDPRTVRQIRDALDREARFDGLILNFKKSGEAFWNELTITPMAGPDGRVDHYVGVTRDVTARRLAEEKLRRLEARHRFLFDHVEAAIVLHGPDREVLYANAMAAQFLGMAENGLLGATDQDPRWSFLREDGSPLPLAEFPVNQALARGAAVNGLVVGHRRPDDGKLVWLMGNAAPVTDPDGTPLVVVSFIDVTALKETGLELDRAKMAAEAAAVAKSEFLANMSHEIRTPLTAMIGFAGLVDQDRSLSAAARAHLGRVVESGRTLLALVNDILDFSRLEAGQAYLEPHAFDPREAVAASLELVGAAAAEKGLALRVAASPHLPLRVFADSARFKQIVLNLLANAVKFTPAGEVAVTLDYPGGSGVLTLEVADTGVGIPEDKLESVFQRFSQVDASVSRRTGGAGLGLAIVRELARLMGGDVKVRSRVGEGSTFTLTLPAPEGAGAAPEPEASEAECVDAARVRILVVDDVAQNRELARALLEAAGFQVEEAEDGLGAVEAARTGAFDLILMDMQMPGMDGLAATRAIRASGGPKADLPILAFSANVLPDQVARCLEAGMNDHVPKPVNVRELISKISRWVEPAAAEAAA